MYEYVKYWSYNRIFKIIIKEERARQLARFEKASSRGKSPKERRPNVTDATNFFQYSDGSPENQVESQTSTPSPLKGGKLRKTKNRREQSENIEKRIEEKQKEVSVKQENTK